MDPLTLAIMDTNPDDLERIFPDKSKEVIDQWRKVIAETRDKYAIPEEVLEGFK